MYNRNINIHINNFYTNMRFLFKIWIKATTISIFMFINLREMETINRISQMFHIFRNRKL